MIWLEEFAPGQRYVSPCRRVDAAAIKALAFDARSAASEIRMTFEIRPCRSFPSIASADKELSRLGSVCLRLRGRCDKLHRERMHGG
jgi:hypothetical protein